MSKIKSLCGKCTNNCKEGFTIFTREEPKKIVEKFSFLKVVKSGISVVGKTKKNYVIVKCDNLLSDGACEKFPQNAPAWCKIKA